MMGMESFGLCCVCVLLLACTSCHPLLLQTEFKRLAIILTCSKRKKIKDVLHSWCIGSVGPLWAKKGVSEKMEALSV